MKDKFNVNLDILVSNGLSFEGYFILWCLITNEESTLLNYTRNCRKIPTEIFNLLEQQQLITINRQQITDNNITYNSLKITQSGKQLFNVQDFDKMFEEFRQSYPTKAGISGRRLHLDLKRCKTLYKKIIGTDAKLHEAMCNCAKLYAIEKRRTNSEVYMQNLATWLHQENYTDYLEEAQKVELISEEGGQSEDI